MVVALLLFSPSRSHRSCKAPWCIHFLLALETPLVLCGCWGRWCWRPGSLLNFIFVVRGIAESSWASCLHASRVNFRGHTVIMNKCRRFSGGPAKQQELLISSSAQSDCLTWWSSGRSCSCLLQRHNSKAQGTDSRFFKCIIKCAFFY